MVWIVLRGLRLLLAPGYFAVSMPVIARFESRLRANAPYADAEAKTVASVASDVAEGWHLQVACQQRQICASRTRNLSRRTDTYGRYAPNRD